LEGIRPFVDRFVELESPEGITDQLREALPLEGQLRDAIVRLVVEYPREWESSLDEAAIREYAAETFEFHLVKRPQMEARVRLPEGQIVGSMTALELLDLYWKANHTEPDDIETLQALAVEIIQGDSEE
jgi:exonuclease SbcD